MSKMTNSCNNCPTYKNKKYLVGNCQYCVFETPMNSKDKVFIARDDINECKHISSVDESYKDIIELYDADRVMDKLTE